MQGTPSKYAIKPSGMEVGISSHKSLKSTLSLISFPIAFRIGLAIGIKRHPCPIGIRCFPSIAKASIVPQTLNIPKALPVGKIETGILKKGQPHFSLKSLQKKLAFDDLFHKKSRLFGRLKIIDCGLIMVIASEHLNQTPLEIRSPLPKINKA